jgi:hypothetical protein
MAPNIEKSRLLVVDSRGRAQVIDNAGHHDAEYGNRDRQVHEPFLDRHRRRQEKRLDNREDSNEENAREQVRHQLVHDLKITLFFVRVPFCKHFFVFKQAQPPYNL